MWNFDTLIIIMIVSYLGTLEDALKAAMQKAMEDVSQLMNEQQQKGLETTRSEETPTKKIVNLQSPTHSKYFQ